MTVQEVRKHAEFWLLKEFPTVFDHQFLDGHEKGPKFQKIFQECSEFLEKVVDMSIQKGGHPLEYDMIEYGDLYPVFPYRGDYGYQGYFTALMVNDGEFVVVKRLLFSEYNPKTGKRKVYVW